MKEVHELMDINNAPDYGFWGLSEDEAAQVLRLNPRQLEYAYRIKELENRMEDASNTVTAVLEDYKDENDVQACVILSAVDEKALIEITEIFEDNHDCNADDVSQWESAVRTYVNRNRPGKDGDGK